MLAIRLLGAQKSAARTLSGCEILPAVGPLCEALTVDDRRIRALTEPVLIRLLPRMKASDSFLLNDGQRAILHRALLRSKPEFALAILAALEQVDDHQAIAPVARLSS